jgi:hypothetical protein
MTDTDPLIVAAMALARERAEANPITLNEALTEIQQHADDQLPPAVACLLKHLRIMHVAEGLPPRLAAHVLNVGRELRANKPAGGAQ